MGLGARGSRRGRSRARAAPAVPAPALAPDPCSTPFMPSLSAASSGSYRWSCRSPAGRPPYWHALFDQGAEDLGNIQMLWTRHGARDVRDALYYAFVAPWAAWPLAAIVLALAGLVARRARRERADGWRAARARLRTVSALRLSVPGDLHQPLRAAAGDSDGVSGRRGNAGRPGELGPGARDSDGDVRRARRRHLAGRLRQREGAGVPSVRRSADGTGGGRGAAGHRDGPARAARLAQAARVGRRSAEEPRARPCRAAAARMARGGEVLEQRRPLAGLVRRRSGADRHRPRAARPAGLVSLAAAVPGAHRRRPSRRDGLGTASIVPSGTWAKAGR